MNDDNKVVRSEIAQPTFTAMERADIAGQIKEQFPAEMPSDDYQSEFIFGVKLDYRDWRIVLDALSPSAAPSAERFSDPQAGFVDTMSVTEIIGRLDSLAAHGKPERLRAGQDAAWRVACREAAKALRVLSGTRSATRGNILREAAQIARDSYPKDSVFDERMKIAAHSIAGTLERMASAADRTTP